MQQYLLQGFGVNQNHGNKALVIAKHQLNAQQKQDFAKEQNLPVCVFIDDNSVDNFTIDFYYPHRQSPMCLHGSLAAAKIYFTNYSVTQAQIQTKQGAKLDITMVNHEQIQLSVRPEIINKPLPSLQEVSELLNLEPHFIQDITLASVGSPKLLVKMVTLEKVLECTPNLAQIVNWGKEQSINGIYAYYKQGGHITGRNFNHLDPTLEDSATGVAAGALTHYCRDDLIVHQGINLNNHCQIITKYSPDLIYIIGKIYLLE